MLLETGSVISEFIKKSSRGRSLLLGFLMLKSNVSYRHVIRMLYLNCDFAPIKFISSWFHSFTRVECNTTYITYIFSVFGLTAAVAEEGTSGTGGTLRRDFFKEEYTLNNAIGRILKILLAQDSAHCLLEACTPFLKVCIILNCISLLNIISFLKICPSTVTVNTEYMKYFSQYTSVDFSCYLNCPNFLVLDVTARHFSL